MVVCNTHRPHSTRCGAAPRAGPSSHRQVAGRSSNSTRPLRTESELRGGRVFSHRRCRGSDCAPFGRHIHICREYLRTGCSITVFVSESVIGRGGARARWRPGAPPRLVVLYARMPTSRVCLDNGRVAVLRPSASRSERCAATIPPLRSLVESRSVHPQLRLAAAAQPTSELVLLARVTLPLALHTRPGAFSPLNCTLFFCLALGEP